VFATTTSPLAHSTQTLPNGHFMFPTGMHCPAVEMDSIGQAQHVLSAPVIPAAQSGLYLGFGTTLSITRAYPVITVTTAEAGAP
jgi:hypothetical protein